MNEETKILELYLYNHKLKFNEIEKKLKIRSNKLAYHIQNLIKKGILIKEKEIYSLSEKSEKIIPYLSEKQTTLCSILINIGNNKETFLYKRNKRPYKDLLSLPGGRLLVGESIEESVKRIMKDKFNITAKLKKINSVSLEHLKKNNKTIHSFILILATATTKDKITLVNIEKSKSKIIKSDYKLLKNDLSLNSQIKTINSKV
ncbi:MAG: hypothetical protein WC796_02585 [Candidatus Pacearchaeota archaeon]|jgi:ADP-ribose pyrophosphatase YjhB (NUDIX family)